MQHDPNSYTGQSAAIRGLNPSWKSVFSTLNIETQYTDVYAMTDKTEDCAYVTVTLEVKVTS